MLFLLNFVNKFMWLIFGNLFEYVLSCILLLFLFDSVYEDRELQAAEKRAQERLEFENQIIKIHIKKY